MPSRLKFLELAGFKTFATKTGFVFGDKITAIVGPNGSGKSNVADAVRWVLGEQSFSLLRGKKTEDMIFAGSELRSRANVAQASVTFDNSDGWLPIDFGEVSIARRAYRDGNNEYLLNGQRARLRDISELLGKVGLSERTYTIVGQGLVDTALSISADERRALFEEAAGIGLYRAKRDDSLRKLEQTQRNLERVHDILAEIGPRLRTLERQAARARDYSQVKTELDGVLKTWYGFHWHEAQKNLTAAKTSAEVHADTLAALQSEQQTLDRSLGELRAKISALRGQINAWGRDSSRLRADSESLSRRLAVADERLRSHAEQRDSLAAELLPLEADVTAQSERLDQARAELAAIETERGAARARLGSLEAERLRRETERATLAAREADAKRRAAGLTARINERKAHRDQLIVERQRLMAAKTEQAAALMQAESLVAEKYAAAAEVDAATAAARSRHDQTESAITGLLASIAQTETELAVIGGRLTDAITAEQRLAARAEVLSPMRAGLGGDPSGLSLLRRAARENSISLVAELADIITAPPEFDAAIAAALGPLLNAALLHDPAAALDLLSQSQGRAALLPLDHLRAASLDPSLAEAVANRDDALGVAAALVTCEAKYRPLVDALLGRVVIARTRQAAQQIAPMLPDGGAAVTLSGEIFFANGPIIAGLDSSASVLALAREWRDLPVEIEHAKEARRNFENTRAAHEADLRRLRAERDDAASALRGLQTAERAAVEARDAAKLELERAEAQARLRRDQIASLEAQMANAAADETALSAELESLAAEADDAERTAQGLATQTGQRAADELAEALAEWQTKAAVADRAAADSAARLDEMQSTLHRAAALFAARQSRLQAVTSDMEKDAADSAHEREQLAKLNAQLSALAAESAPAEKRLSDSETELTGVESAEADIRANLHAAERQHTEAQLDYGRKKDEIESLRRHISEDFGLVALEYTDDFTGPTPLPLEGVVEHLPRVDILPEGIEDSLDRYRRQLRRMGGINPEALNEYKEVKERHEFLTTQVADLETAAGQLREVIAELDVLMEREFRRTFEAVAEHFKDTFSRLFGGGTAKLVLTEPDSLTTTGIDILARLPGRKQQGLALLSGGERALTACALIFAILRVNPPPFAMLDEVDAALDEANVGRFRDLLLELSQATQFVVITHNRHTVQAADTVYGISMGNDSASQAISLRLDGETVAA